MIGAYARKANFVFKKAGIKGQLKVEECKEEKAFRKEEMILTSLKDRIEGAKEILSTDGHLRPNEALKYSRHGRFIEFVKEMNEKVPFLLKEDNKSVNLWFL